MVGSLQSLPITREAPVGALYGFVKRGRSSPVRMRGALAARLEYVFVRARALRASRLTRKEQWGGAGPLRGDPQLLCPAFSQNWQWDSA